MNKNEIHDLLFYILKILKLFFLTTVLGGLLFGIFRSISLNSLNGFYQGMAFGVMLATAVIPILILIDLIQRVKVYLRYNVFFVSVKQERIFSVECDYDAIFEFIVNFLKDDEKTYIKEKEKGNKKIIAIFKLSWKSFGEKIVIQFFNISRANLYIKLSSYPLIPVTLIDYCKNFENVEYIMETLGEEYNIIENRKE